MCLMNVTVQSRRDDDDGFPTPTSLMAAQQRYNKSSKKQSPKKNENEVPEPFPPPTLKSEIYNVADYTNVDSHASKVYSIHFISFPHSYYFNRFAVNCKVCTSFLARDSIYAIARYMPSPVRPSVCLSVCPSVTRVDQSKTVEVRITQSSPQCSPMTLVS